MVPLLLLPLLWGGSLQEAPGYELRLKEDVTVQEGQCVHVPCSFSYPWSSWSPPFELYMYWYRSRDNIRQSYPVATNNPHVPVRPETSGRFRLLEDPTTNSCSLNISNARMSNTGSYFFRVERGYSVKYNYGDKKLNLQVTEPLESGRHTSLTCSLSETCERGRPLIFTWVGEALYSLGRQAPCSSVLTFTPRPQDHGTNLTCRVKQGDSVTKERTIQLNVSYAPQNLTIYIFSRNVTAFEILQTTSPLLILECQALRLLCAADSNPPAALSWFRGSPAPNATPISSTAILELPRVGTAEEGELTCQARHPLGSPSVSLSLSVQRSPPSCRCVTEEQQGSWPLVLTLIRGALMGAGFLLTYGLTWIYYTRCGGPQRTRPRS